MVKSAAVAIVELLQGHEAAGATVFLGVDGSTHEMRRLLNDTRSTPALPGVRIDTVGGRGEDVFAGRAPSRLSGRPC